MNCFETEKEDEANRLLQYAGAVSAHSRYELLNTSLSRWFRRVQHLHTTEHGPARRRPQRPRPKSWHEDGGPCICPPCSRTMILEFSGGGSKSLDDHRSTTSHPVQLVPQYYQSALSATKASSFHCRFPDFVPIPSNLPKGEIRNAAR